MRVATLSGVAAVSAFRARIGVCIRYVNAIYGVIGRSCESRKAEFLMASGLLLGPCDTNPCTKVSTSILTRMRLANVVPNPRDCIYVYLDIHPLQ